MPQPLSAVITAEHAVANGRGIEHAMKAERSDGATLEAVGVEGADVSQPEEDRHRHGEEDRLPDEPVDRDPHLLL